MMDRCVFCHQTSFPNFQSGGAPTAGVSKDKWRVQDRFDFLGSASLESNTTLGRIVDRDLTNGGQWLLLETQSVSVADWYLRFGECILVRRLRPSNATRNW